MEPENRSSHSNRPSSSLPAALVLLVAVLSLGAPASATPSCRATERFSDEPCVGRKPQPAELDDFLRRPTRSQWEAQLDRGWGGSDGSTAAPDVIAGVRIGATSRAHEDVDLPANRHDWYYELGRTYGLGWRFRLAADRAYRDMCLELVKHLDGVAGVLARTDVQLRYAALRVAGFGAWLAHPGPAVPPGPDTTHIAAAP